MASVRRRSGSSSFCRSHQPSTPRCRTASCSSGYAVKTITCACARAWLLGQGSQSRELDALAPRRASDVNQSTERVVDLLLTDMDGTEDRAFLVCLCMAASTLTCSAGPGGTCQSREGSPGHWLADWTACCKQKWPSCRRVVGRLASQTPPLAEALCECCAPCRFCAPPRGWPHRFAAEPAQTAEVSRNRCKMAHLIYGSQHPCSFALQLRLLCNSSSRWQQPGNA